MVTYQIDAQLFVVVSSAPCGVASELGDFRTDVNDMNTEPSDVVSVTTVGKAVSGQ